MEPNSEMRLLRECIFVLEILAMGVDFKNPPVINRIDASVKRKAQSLRQYS